MYEKVYMISIDKKFENQDIFVFTDSFNDSY